MEASDKKVNAIRTTCQARSSIEPVSVTAPILEARAFRAGATRLIRTCTAAVVRRAVRQNHSVIKCRCDAAEIVQKGLAFGRHWSGTVGQFRAPRAPRDPAPPAPLPRWGFGGAARRRGTRTRDLDVQVFEEATEGVSASGRSNRKTIATHCARCCAEQS